MDVIEVENLSKRYRLGQLGPGSSLRETLVALARPRRRGPRSDIWALHDISFTLSEGATLGIIGRNGSGKSTMLKILSKITEPTLGTSRTRGRVASLLEVGTGFHDELTGRDNVYLNGAIMGMSRGDIAARLEEIVEFAGVARFLDTPIKRYSTGMHLRLAFSVAAHLEPDILLVDEVLAVGDVDFQQRCLGKMESAGAEGRTVVFVSHDLTAVERLCRRSIWLERGDLREDGPTSNVLDRYSASFTEANGDVQLTSGPVTVHAVRALDPTGAPVARVRRDRPFRLELEFSLDRPQPDLDLALILTSRSGVRVLDEAWTDHDHAPIRGPGWFTAGIQVPPIFNSGEYRIGIWLGTPHEVYIDEPGVAELELEGATSTKALTHLYLPWRLDRHRAEPAS